MRHRATNTASPRTGGCRIFLKQERAVRNGVFRELAIMERGWPTGSLEDRVKTALEEVRPAIRMDGGDVQLLRIDNDVVFVHLSGACDGCPMAQSTLSDFVSERIKLYAPEIESVIAE